MFLLVGTSSEFKKFVLTRSDVMKRGASSFWDVVPRWDVAPEEMAVDDEGSVQLKLGQEFMNIL